VFGDLSPLVSVLLVGLDDHLVFLVCPLLFLDVGVQMVVPALPALFADPAWQLLADLAPVFGPFILDHPHELGILFVSPRSFHKVRIEHRLPPVQALDIAPVLEVLGDLLPVLGLNDTLKRPATYSVLANKPIQFLVLYHEGQRK
jgi:hypothetical protein